MLWIEFLLPTFSLCLILLKSEVAFTYRIHWVSSITGSHHHQVYFLQESDSINLVPNAPLPTPGLNIYLLWDPFHKDISFLLFKHDAYMYNSPYTFCGKRQIFLKSCLSEIAKEIQIILGLATVVSRIMHPLSHQFAPPNPKNCACITLNAKGN